MIVELNKNDFKLNENEFWKEIFNNFKIRKVDSDNYEILLDSTVIIKLNHCYYVSKGFIDEVFETQREFFLQDMQQETKEINMEELLDQAVREGWWNWRRQVAVYKGEVEEKL